LAEVSIVNGTGFYDSLGNIDPVSLLGLVVADCSLDYLGFSATAYRYNLSFLSGGLYSLTIGVYPSIFLTVVGGARSP
jgi:hypothetical protein